MSKDIKQALGTVLKRIRLEQNISQENLGVDVFNIYWKYYPKYRNNNTTYTSLPEFVHWFLSQDPSEITLFRPYDYRNAKQRVNAYARTLNL